MKDLPSIKDIVYQYGLMPTKTYAKHYGQNFLFDLSIIHRIVEFARLTSKACVLEVGPGPGGLSQGILMKEPEILISIEYDPLCCKALSYLNEFKNFKLVQDDALTFPLLKAKEIAQSNQPFHIVANLPYNISTELLARWISQINHVASMTLMFQKEVADRILAKPHTRDYSRLTVLAQLFCSIEKGFDLPPHVFTPAPKIYSSVIHLTPLQNADKILPYIDAIQYITHIAFHQRRKQIKGPLKAIWGDKTEEILKSVHIDPTLRAENLTPQQFLTLSKGYKDGFFLEALDQ